MSLWNPHRPQRWAALAAGTLSPFRRRRALAHLRGCAGCAHRYETLVFAERALAGGRAHQPSPTELRALRQANLAQALAAAREPAVGARLRPGPAALRWVPALGLAVLALFALPWLRPGPSPDAEFTPRGEAQPLVGATLRLFCARLDAPLAELTEGASCPVGATLAFAARFESPPQRVVLALSGTLSQRVELALQHPAGEERSLPHTVLLQSPGAYEAVLSVDGRELRQRFRVEPAR